MKEYLKRYIDIELKESLEYVGAIVIVGPKWVGKTTTAKQFAKTIIELQNPKLSESYLLLADTDPIELLKGEKPVLIDEWQMAPKLWDTVRYLVDESNNYGEYILTGSTIIDNEKIMHSGVGRIKRLKMRPMSLYESGESTGEIPLLELFHNSDFNINGKESKLNIHDLIFAACRGGWPETLNIKSKKHQLKIAQDYLDILCQTDASKIDGVKRNPERVKSVIKSYARNISTVAKDTTLLKDTKGKYEDMSKPTFNSYSDILERLFIIENIPAWSPNIRSASAIRKKPKKVFIDPSLAVASLNLTPEKILHDFKLFGFIFENLCIRDLLIYSSQEGGEVLYYRDDSGLEADCILKLNDNSYALIEIKLGSKKIDEGSEHLIKLKKLIKEKREKGETKLPDPNFLAVITGNGVAHTRKDGVKVIPIGCLR